MSFRTKVSAIAVTAAACMLFAPAAMASSGPIQVTGRQLKSALLPASDFLAGYSAGAELDSVGLLMDFSQVKKAIQCLIQTLDHHFLNDMAPFDVINPSAENIARHIHQETSRLLPPSPAGAVIASITVWETDTTAATFRP